MKWKMRFAHERIAKLRESVSESQYHFGRRCGIPPQYVSLYEQGETMPRLQTLMNLCESFQLPIGHFFEEKHANNGGFKHHIFVCLNQRPKDDPRGCCADSGSEQLHAFFKKEVERLGLHGIVRANKAGCLDHCDLGPSIVIYPEGIWYWVGNETDVTEIMERHIVKGEIVERLLMPGHEVPPLRSEARATSSQ